MNRHHWIEEGARDVRAGVARAQAGHLRPRRAAPPTKRACRTPCAACSRPAATWTAWPIPKALRAGDAVAGVPVLMELYEEMKDRPAPVDLPALWRRLGVQVRRGSVELRDDAPLAGIRRAITAAQTRMT